MNKNFFIGVVCGIVMIITVVVALGAIYDYVPEVARIIWPDSIRYKEIEIHQESIFDEEVIGSIPMNYLTKTHICEIWDGEPKMVSGLFLYEFDTDEWVWCQ